MIEIKDHSGLMGRTTKSYSPSTSEELIRFLLKYKDSKFRIGGGLTGVSGGAIPEEEEIFINFSNYKSIEWIDKEEGVFTVSAGNTLMEIKDFVEVEGWNFPILPGSLDRATIGGMIACNGGGPFSLRYGKIGNFVRAVEIVTPQAEKLHFGSRVKKVSEGPNFTKLFVGSEGSLGFISKVTLNCIKLPGIEHYRISHTNFEKLAYSVSLFLGYNPLYMEMAEPDALRFSSGHKESVMWLGLEKGTLFNPNSYKEFNIVSLSPDNLNERFDIGKNLQQYKKFIDFDISFPVKNGAKLLSKLKNLLNSLGMESAFFGHAGDGNWHIHVFYEEEDQITGKMVNSFDELLFKYEGHISGEHGIGRLHKKRFTAHKEQYYQSLYSALKSHLDPKNQLPSIF